MSVEIWGLFWVGPTLHLPWYGWLCPSQDNASSSVCPTTQWRADISTQRDGTPPHNSHGRIGSDDMSLEELTLPLSWGGHPSSPANLPGRHTSWALCWLTLTSIWSMAGPVERQLQGTPWLGGNIRISKRSFSEGPMMIVCQRTWTGPKTHSKEHMWLGLMEQKCVLRDALQVPMPLTNGEELERWERQRSKWVVCFVSFLITLEGFWGASAEGVKYGIVGKQGGIHDVKFSSNQ